MSYEYKPHTWVPKEVISADKMNELEKAAEQVGKLQPVSETGSYNDLTEKPKINGNELSEDMSTTDIGLHTVAQSGEYDELENRPSINGNLLTGNKTTTQIGLHTVAESGNYEELNSKPHINGVEITGDKSAADLQFHSVAMSGSYNELNNQPSINGNLLSGDKTAQELGFADVSMSGSYADLSNPPAVSTFANDKKYQTETEVATKIANANHLKRQIVEQLPDAATADVNTIYMVKLSNGVEQNTYAEYMVLEGKWEKLGTSDVDLTNYMKTTDINNELDQKVPITRKVNNKPLSGDITLAAADVNAVPITRTVNSKSLSDNIDLTYTDVDAVPTSRTINSKPLTDDIVLSANDVSAVPTTRKVNGNTLDADVIVGFEDLTGTENVATKEYVTKQIDDIQIGGTNLLPNTKDVIGHIHTDSNAKTDGTYNGFTVVTVDARNFPVSTWGDTIEWRNRRDDMGIIESAVNIEPDTDYTLSFYAKGTGSCSSFLYPDAVSGGYGSNGQSPNVPDGQTQHTLTSNWQRFWVVWHTANTISGKKNVLPARVYSGSQVWVCGVKFEKGNKPTDWSPAPEDPVESAKTADKLANQRKISLTGDVTGSINFDGSTDVAITTNHRGCVISASSDGKNFTKPWVKFASYINSNVGTNVDVGITFLVSEIYHERCSEIGILNVELRHNVSGNRTIINPAWTLASSTLKPEDFVAAYKSEDNGNKITLELWMKMEAWDGTHFTKLEEGYRLGAGVPFTLYNYHEPDGQAESIPSDMTQVVSYILPIQNPAPVAGITYQEGEIDTGNKWIDGKPIYRRVFAGTKTTTADFMVTTDFTLNSFDTLLFYSGLFGRKDWVYLIMNWNENNSNKQYMAWPQIGAGGISITGQSTGDYVIIVDYTKADPGATPALPEGPEMFDMQYVDAGVARADYIAMMSGIEIPDGAETVVESGAQSDPNGAETPGIESESAPSAKYDAVARYYEYDCWSAAMVRNAVGKWITADEAEEILNKN